MSDYRRNRERSTERTDRRSADRRNEQRYRREKRSGGENRRRTTPQRTEEDRRQGNREKQTPGFFNAFTGNSAAMSMTKIVGLIVVGILVVMLLVKIGMIFVSGIGPFLNSLSALMDQLLSRFIEAAIAGAVIYVLLMMFLGRFIPITFKMKLLPIIIIIALIYTIVPALGTVLGELAILVIGIVILLTLLRF